MNTMRILALVLSMTVAAAQAAEPGGTPAVSPAAKVGGAANSAGDANRAAEVNPAVDVSPAVNTSPAASVTTQPPASASAVSGAPPTADAASPANVAASRAGRAQATARDDGRARTAHGAATSAADSIQLGTTEISGNRELPKLLYIVPWQRAQVGKFSGRPPNSLVDETLTPVDRSVFERQNRYYAALEASTQPAVAQSPASQAGTAPAAAAAGSARDEK